MNRFRVLSLDGGGIRGAFAAAFLAELERELGGPIRRYFDLVAGTSTGGIIALAASLDEPMERVLEFYKVVGPKIFARRPPAQLRFRHRLARWLSRSRVSGLGVNFDDLFQTRYEITILKTALTDVLGTRTLLDAKTRVLIPAVDLSRGAPVVFKTPHLPDASSRDRRFQVVDIALATSAAPTYFPHASFDAGTAYIDGGIWANNPVVVALAETMRIRSTTDGVEILSLGTGKAKYAFLPPGSEAGLTWWGPKLLEAMAFSQSEGLTHIARFFLGDRCERVDFDLPDKTWQLDGVEHIDRLIHFGREEAHGRLASLRATFCDAPADECDWSCEGPPPQPFIPLGAGAAI